MPVKSQVLAGALLTSAAVGACATPSSIGKRQDSLSGFDDFARPTASFAPNETVIFDGTCTIDRTQAPGDLSGCGNATLFDVWRPKAHVLAREGFMNDPMAIWETTRNNQSVSCT